MIFKSIKLENFRQYKSKLKVDFSVPENGNNTITLIVAANGVGKTTLLQAVRYCFYGESHYLNLPNSNELINNRVENELKEMEETSMYVEVEFEHNELHYVARRERSFQKNSGKMKPIGKEGFEIRQATKDKGFRNSDADAMEVIRRILPEGLSQVFMFDGERMEQNISDRDFSKDLKSSIIGILGIHKYERLINVLGAPGRTSTVLGLLNNFKKIDKTADFTIIMKYKNTLAKIDEHEQIKNNLNEQIEDIEQKIKLSKDKQLKLAEVKELSFRVNITETEIKQLEKDLKSNAEKYILQSHDAIIQKRLLEVNQVFQQYINNDANQQNYYSYLHIKTIEDIQKRGICICGRPIGDHQDSNKHLEELKKTSLPQETAQYMNLISQKFNQSVEFKDNFNKLNDIHKTMNQIRRTIEAKNKEVNNLKEEITKIEKLVGFSFQEEIDQLFSKKSELSLEMGKNDKNLELLQKSAEILSKDIEIIDSLDIYNKKVNIAINDVLALKEKFMNELNALDARARKVLSKHFDDSLSAVMTGKYQVRIDEKYNIQIQDLIAEKDVTTSLSTGQNVIVSLSFIDALIKTAKEINNKTGESYGVLMDAAISNLDEKHIEKLCQHNLNKMDQLIFLSFRRQLRNEMFNGIRNQIGKAYHLVKDGNNGVQSKEIPLNTLEQYIHEIEENDD